MIKFFTTYYDEVLKPSIKWSKKHWKGLIVLTFVLDIIPFGYMYYQNKKSEKEHEEFMKFMNGEEEA